MKALRAIAVIVLIALTVEVVQACCMVPRSYKGDVDQAEQQVVILHANGHQEMAIRVAPFFQSKKEAKPGDPDADLDAVGTPEYIAWVLTVPGKPTGYRLCDRKVFKEGVDLQNKLERLAREQRAAQSQFISLMLSSMGMAGNRAAAADSIEGIQVSAPVTVGPYTITEVKALGASALAELNRYLEEHGFPTEDADHMRYFIENNFTFLCIRITPPEGTAKLGKHLDLEALQVGFDTPKPYYPGKFSSRQGNFKLSLTLLTADTLLSRDLGNKFDQLNDEYRGSENLWTVQPLPDLLKKVSDAAASFKDVQRWHVNSCFSGGFNPLDQAGNPTIWQWKDDVFFQLGGEDDGPPDWYYGDREINFAERAWREHSILMLSTLPVVALAAFVGIRKRRRLKAQKSPAAK